MRTVIAEEKSRSKELENKIKVLSSKLEETDKERLTIAKQLKSVEDK